MRRTCSNWDWRGAKECQSDGSKIIIRSFPTNILLRMLASIQPRTRRREFGYLENSIEFRIFASNLKSVESESCKASESKWSEHALPLRESAEGACYSCWPRARAHLSVRFSWYARKRKQNKIPEPAPASNFTRTCTDHPNFSLFFSSSFEFYWTLTCNCKQNTWW